ncbi:hypothetical protein B0H14DRAFT_3722596 [Mycena olivaceomarginata]|nr:hypothetical protein B0H14DRAFT_3722596 [Mycena olivaceomarginata]
MFTTTTAPQATETHHGAIGEQNGAAGEHQARPHPSRRRRATNARRVPRRNHEPWASNARTEEAAGDHRARPHPISLQASNAHNRHGAAGDANARRAQGGRRRQRQTSSATSRISPALHLVAGVRLKPHQLRSRRPWARKRRLASRRATNGHCGEHHVGDHRLRPFREHTVVDDRAAARHQGGPSAVGHLIKSKRFPDRSQTRCHFARRPDVEAE